MDRYSRQRNKAISSVQSFSRVQLFAAPWIAARQASLSFTNSQSLLKLMFIKSVMPSNHLILCHPSYSPAFNLSQHQGPFQSQLFTPGGQSTGASALASVLPVTIQDWFPLGLTGWIPLMSKGLSRVFSNTIWKHQFFGGPTLTSIHDHWNTQGQMALAAPPFSFYLPGSVRPAKHCL